MNYSVVLVASILCLCSVAASNASDRIQKVDEVCIEKDSEGECKRYECTYERSVEHTIDTVHDEFLRTHCTLANRMPRTLEERNSVYEFIDSNYVCTAEAPTKGLELVDVEVTYDPVQDDFQLEEGCHVEQRHCLDSSPRLLTEAVSGKQVTVSDVCWRESLTISCPSQAPLSCSRLARLNCMNLDLPKCIEEKDNVCVRFAQQWTCPSTLEKQLRDAGFEYQIQDGKAPDGDSETCKKRFSELKDEFDSCRSEKLANDNIRITCRNENKPALDWLNSRIKSGICESINEDTFVCKLTLSQLEELQKLASLVQVSNAIVTDYSWEKSCNKELDDKFTFECSPSVRTCLQDEEGDFYIDGVKQHVKCTHSVLTQECLNDHNEDCKELEANPACRRIKSECAAGDAQCSRPIERFECTEEPAEIVLGTVCDDQFCIDDVCRQDQEAFENDFVNTVVQLEIARQASVYGDHAADRFFNGNVMRCKDRAGATSCCKAKVTTTGSNTMFSQFLILGTNAAKEGIKFAGSPFVYDALAYSNKTKKILQYLYGDAPSGTYNPSLNFWGLTLSYSSSSGLSFNFSPAGFALAAATEAYGRWSSCSMNDQRLALLKSRHLCHYIGDECTKSAPGLGCVQVEEVYVCYNSKLAKIINEQGRPQLNRGFGPPHAPEPQGFNYEELAGIDFEKIDFSEFVADVIKELEHEKQQSPELARKRAVDRIKAMVRGEISRRAAMPKAIAIEGNK